MPKRASDRLVERIRRGDNPDMSEVVDAILADSVVTRVGRSNRSFNSTAT